MKDVADPSFQKWIQGNPARASLLMELNNNYNFQAGTALWDMWDEYKQLASPPAKERKRDTMIKDVKTVRNAPSGGAGKPVYSRVKLMELQAASIRGDRAARAKWESPEFQQEYQAAYAEGRVK
jgi:hypothetical protein